MARGPTHPAATAAEPRLRQAGIALTLEGEPTYVPLRPEGAEWSVAADGPSKRGYAKALAAELQRRVWPQATLLFCSGKRDEGEVNPRWALRLIPAAGGRGASAAAQHRPEPGLRAAAPGAARRRAVAGARLATDGGAAAPGAHPRTGPQRLGGVPAAPEPRPAGAADGGDRGGP